MQKSYVIFIFIAVAAITGIYFLLKGGGEKTPASDYFSATTASNATSSATVAVKDKKPFMRHQITLRTTLGEIVFQTYDADAPKTVQNFITLAQKGFYENVIFHRVIPGFMIQGGDPAGTGMGGPGYTFADELNPQTESYKAGYTRGVVAMANAGPNTNGSQFFIMLEDYPLPRNYTIFGKVVAGQGVVEAIGSLKTGPNDRPLNPPSITAVLVKEITTP